MSEPSELDVKSEKELIEESQHLATQIEAYRERRVEISQHLAARRKREEDLRAELARMEAERAAEPVVNATVAGQSLEVKAVKPSKEK